MLNKQLFILAHQIGDASFYSTYKSLVKNQWRPYKELKEEQEKQLRIIICYCYENVPYYRKLFNNLRINPDAIKTVEDLQKLPVLTKQTIKENWDALKPVNLNRIHYHERATGGSTGTPFKYRISSNDRFLSGALLYRGWGYAGYNLSDRMVFLAGSSLDTGTKSGLEKKVHEYLRNIRKLSSFNMGDLEMKSYATLIREWKPMFIRGYPSSISQFCEWLENENISLPSPKAILTTSEKNYPIMREKISSYFKAPVFDGYGLGDGGVSAFECEEHTGLHIDMEKSVMELVDERGDVIESGEGTILATSLHNFAMPFLRYDTGDIAVIANESCTCGRAYPILNEIIGRSVDILITPEGTKVHGWFFLYIFWEYGVGIKEYQVVQETLEKIIIKIVPEDGFDEKQLDRIREVVAERSPGWDIEVKYVDTIARTGSGKYKFIINELVK